MPVQDNPGMEIFVPAAGQRPRAGTPRAPGAAPEASRVAGDESLRALVRRLRHRYQKGLVAWLRGQAPASGLDEMRAVLDQLETLCGGGELGRLWWVSAGLVEALREDALDPDVAAGPLLSGLDRHMKRLADEGAGALATTPPAELLDTLTGCVARAAASTPRVAAVRESVTSSAGAPPAAGAAPGWSEGLCELTEGIGRGNTRIAEGARTLHERVAELESQLASLHTQLRRLQVESAPSARALGGGNGAGQGVAAARALARLERAYALSQALAKGLEQAERLSRALGEGTRELTGVIDEQARANTGLAQALRRLESPGERVVEQALLVDIGAETFGVPLHQVEAVVRPAAWRPEAGQCSVYDHASGRFPVLELASLVGGRGPHTRSARVSLVLLRCEGRRVALPVDAVAGPQTITVEPLAPPLGVTPWVQGAAVLGEARVVLVLAVAALLEAAG